MSYQGSLFFDGELIPMKVPDIAVFDGKSSKRYMSVQNMYGLSVSSDKAKIYPDPWDACGESLLVSVLKDCSYNNGKEEFGRVSDGIQRDIRSEDGMQLSYFELTYANRCSIRAWLLPHLAYSVYRLENCRPDGSVVAGSPKTGPAVMIVPLT